MENMLVMLAQYDNEGRAEVTKDNMRSLAHQGYWQHPPVVGYDKHKIHNDIGKLRPTLKHRYKSTARQAGTRAILPGRYNQG